MRLFYFQDSLHVPEAVSKVHLFKRTYIYIYIYIYINCNKENKQF